MYLREWTGQSNSEINNYSVNEIIWKKDAVGMFNIGSEHLDFVLASKRTVDVITEEDKEEECSAHQEEVLSRLRNEVSGVVTMPHPIMFDTYDICELASGGKLKSTFSVSVLRDICLALGIDVSQIMVKRKQPYIDALLELVSTCTCASGQVNPTLK